MEVRMREIFALSVADGMGLDGLDEEGWRVPAL